MLEPEAWVNGSYRKNLFRFLASQRCQWCSPGPFWSHGRKAIAVKISGKATMNGSSFQDIEKLEADLWSAADNLRANSKLTSSDYFMPVLGIIFLRHAANRFDDATRQIDDDKAAGKMPGNENKMPGNENKRTCIASLN